MKPVVFRELLPRPLLDALRLYVRALLEGGALSWEAWAHRWVRHDDPLFVLVHDTLTPRVAATVGAPVKKSYVFLASYADGSSLPRHRDREQCRYTLDVCLEDEGGGGPWPLFVAGDEIVLGANDAVLYRGMELEHWRDPKPAGKTANLAFFHFVDADFDGPLD